MHFTMVVSRLFSLFYVEFYADTERSVVELARSGSICCLGGRSFFDGQCGAGFFFAPRIVIWIRFKYFEASSTHNLWTVAA